MDRLVPWALARSIWASAMQLHAAMGKEPKMDLLPSLHADGIVLFGSSGLAFSDNSLIGATQKGWAVPRLMNFMASPFTALRALQVIISISKIHRFKEIGRLQAEVILRSGLEATVTYMNFHPYCQELFFNEVGATFGIGFRDEGPIWKISWNSVESWQVSDYLNDEELFGELLFTDYDSAISCSVGMLSHLIAAGSGKILLAGRIPLLDKFGYASRIAQKEVPQP